MMSTYRFEQFRREHLREALSFQGGKDPGWEAPAFDLATVGGGRARKADYAGRPFLVLFASLTDPVPASAAGALKRLYREFELDIDFLTIYVREAHPGDIIPQPSTMEDKTKHARRSEARDGIPWTVAVDDLDGSVHRAFGGNGASAFLVDPKGDVAFRTLFSTDVRALRRALHAMRRGADHPRASDKAVLPALAGLARYDDVVRAAGQRAVDDLRRETPLVYAAAEVAWVWRTLTPLGRLATVAAVAAVGFAVVRGSAAVRRRWA